MWSLDGYTASGGGDTAPPSQGGLTESFWSEALGGIANKAMNIGQGALNRYIDGKTNNNAHQYAITQAQPAQPAQQGNPYTGAQYAAWANQAAANAQATANAQVANAQAAANAQVANAQATNSAGYQFKPWHAIVGISAAILLAVAVRG